MLTDAGEELAQVGFGLEAVERGRADQGVEDRGPLASGIRTGEEPIFPAQSDRPDRILGGVVGDLQPAVVDVARERVPSRAGVAEGASEIAAAGDELQLRVEP